MIIRGIVFVALGSLCYGILATIVKLAYNEGYTTEEVTFAQYSIGWIVLGGIALRAFIQKKKKEQEYHIPRKYSVLWLVLAGTSLGFTGVFYYRAVLYIPVSLCIVLLMQSVWMGVVLEAILERKRPETNKIIAVLLVLIGTLLATEVYKDVNGISWQGVSWGMLGALSYTISLYTSNRIGLELSNKKRSFWMMTGGFTVVTIAALPVLMGDFSWSVFYPWGILLAVFGTVLPPLLMNKGMPLTGMGLGSIIVSLEIPVSVSMAFLFLGERINSVQWGGVGLIIFSIVLLNVNRLRKK